jgi:acyl-coenzyme A synthetase/AMP-(fatty) acid ligase
VPVEDVLAPRYDHPRLPLEVQREFREQGHWAGTTLARCVEEWATRDPSRIAVVGDRVLTYGEVWESARRIGGTLQEQGLRPGEYLLAVLHNSWQGLVLEVAASLVGAVFTPRSPHISPVLAANLFEQLDVRGLVLAEELLATEAWLAAFADLRGRLAGRPVMLQGDGSSEVAPEELRLEEIAEQGPHATPVPVNPSAPSLVLATGGTTGTPKSILHSSDTAIYAARRFAEAVEYTEDDVTVAFAPYGHAGGSIFDIYMPLVHGAKVLPLRRWRVPEVGPLIQRWQGTFFVTMGTHVYDLLQQPPGFDENLTSVRLITSGAGPDSLYVDAQARYGFTVVRVYGCGECPGHAIGRPGDPTAIRLHKDGIPFEGISTRIMGPDRTELPVGRIGDYECRGPNLFLGYVGQDDLTAEAITEDGYYRSGDRLVRSEDGYVTWSGRSKEIIRRGGLQIDPVEMETLLSEHPAVETVVVVGEPHPRLGERAVVVAVAHEAVELAELCTYLLDRGLPKQSLPERLVLTAEIPRTELGKFHRARIRASLDSLAEQPALQPEEARRG